MTENDKTEELKPVYPSVTGSDYKAATHAALERAKDRIQERLVEEVEKAVSDPNALTNERHNTHGNYGDNARVAQKLKRVFREELGYRHTRGQPPLSYKQLESLELIATKIGRIIAGESSFPDHWDDIAGYAVLPNKDV